MVVKGKRWILFFVLIWSFFPCQSVYGAEVSSDLSINDYNFSGIDTLSSTFSLFSQYPFSLFEFSFYKYN